MKNPLHYQLTEYDCGPTSMLNALAYLFEREQIPPEIVRETMLFCMDRHGRDGICGKEGTSYMAMMFLSNWYNNFGTSGQLPVFCRYLRGADVNLRPDGAIRTALQEGSAVVVRLWLEEPHYVLLTGSCREGYRMFDPYYEPDAPEETGILAVRDQPEKCNRIVPAGYLDREGNELYALGDLADREAIILTNTENEVADGGNI